MKTSRALAAIRREILAAARNDRGIAAVEFAFLTPIALSIILGAFTAQDLYQIDTKIAVAAGAITDIVSQQSALTETKLASIANLAAPILTPYDPGNLRVSISEIDTDAAGAHTAAWTRSYPGMAFVTLYTLGVPDAVAPRSSYIIYTQVTYTWTPPVGGGIVGPINITKTVARMIRAGTPIPGLT